ncbi:protein kinase domain-containing protein [Pradoshia sp.]
MMMSHTVKRPCSFQIGTFITGKWHHNRYELQKELGFGANGIVYQAHSVQGTVAVKFSDNNATIASEVNVLKSFEKAQGDSLGPSLIDVDDYVVNGKVYPFYVMEFIQGDSLLTFLRKRGNDWLNILSLQLLTQLEQLHQLGWVFGDLKPENLIVQWPEQRIRFIDVGGTTQKGRAIKEYTEYFDRGYWGLGGRRAEPTYDLFSLAMVIMTAAYGKRVPKGDGGLKDLRERIKGKKELIIIEPVLLNAFAGKYASAGEMKRELADAIHKKASSYNRPAAVQTSRMQMRNGNGKQKKGRRMAETLFLILLVTLLYAIYMLGLIV